jgi:hypothetical protein
MKSDGNNVYGLVVAPQGLAPVLQAVRRVIGDGTASIYRSHFNGAETLRFSTESVDFESTPLENGTEHLLNGGVGGSSEEVVAFVRTLSVALVDAGVEHRFEVYKNRELVQLVPS